MRPEFEPPTGNHRLIWNILLSRYTLPLLAVSDEIGVFSVLAASPLSTSEAAARFSLSQEWAEIMLGALAALELTRVQDGRFHVTDTSRSFLVPDSPYYCGGTIQNFVKRDSNTEQLRRALRSPETDSDRYIVRLEAWRVYPGASRSRRAGAPRSVLRDSGWHGTKRRFQWCATSARRGWWGRYFLHRTGSAPPRHPLHRCGTAGCV